MSALDLAELDRIIERRGRETGQLLPILQDAQKQYGYLPEEAMRKIADALGVPLAKVYGVASFYTLFATAPKGRHIIRLCESAPCHIRGAEEIGAALQEELGVEPGQTTPDGLFTLEHASCLGVCGVAPAMMIDDTVFGNLTPAKIKRIIGDYRRGAAVAGE